MRRVCLILLGCLMGSLSFLRADDPPLRNFPETLNPSLWLNAEEGVSLHQGVGDGNVVKAWQSKIGNLEASQSVGDNRVVWSRESEGSKHTLHFRGNSTLAVGETFNLRNSTVFVSIMHGAGWPYQRILSLARVPVTANDYQFNDALAFVVHRDSGFLARVQSGGFNISAPEYDYASTWNVLGYRIDGSGNITVTANGIDGIFKQNAAMAASNTGKLLIGHSPRNIEVEKLVDARIYEILIFNRLLDTDERRSVSAYMEASMNAEVPTLDERPVAGELEYGAKLSKSVLSGGRVVARDNSSVIGDFEWSNPEKVVTRSGNHGVIFVPKFANHSLLEFQVNVPVSGQPPNPNPPPGGTAPAGSDYSEQGKCNKKKKKKCKNKNPKKVKNSKKQKKPASSGALKTKQRGQGGQPKNRTGVPVAASGSSVIMSDGSVRSPQ